MKEKQREIGANVDYEALSEEEMVSLAKQGDQVATGFIFQRYKAFVRAKSRTYFLVGGDSDDLIQEGMIGLFGAIRDFDQEHYDNFNIFAQLCITRQMITAVRRASRKKHSPLNSSVSIDQREYRDDEGSSEDAFMLISREGRPEESVIDKESMKLLQERLCAVLSPFEKTVMNKMKEGKTYRETATEIGKDKKAVDNAIQRIKRKLREIDNDAEEGKPRA